MSAYYYAPPTAREIPDLADNEYLNLTGDVVVFDDIEWLNDDRDSNRQPCSRYLVTVDSEEDTVYLNDDFVEVEV